MTQRLWVRIPILSRSSTGLVSYLTTVHARSFGRIDARGGLLERPLEDAGTPAAGQRFSPVCGERHANNGFGVRVETPQFLARLQVPQANSVVRAARKGLLPIGRKSDALHGQRM